MFLFSRRICILGSEVETLCRWSLVVGRWSLLFPWFVEGVWFYKLFELYGEFRSCILRTAAWRTSGSRIFIGGFAASRRGFF